jgi:hypothetical protein
MQELDGEAWSEIIPAHPCEAEATMLARSMFEVEGAGGATWWERTQDRLYCGAHFEPGAMAHLDGRVTQHPVMAVADA